MNDFVFEKKVLVNYFILLLIPLSAWLSAERFFGLDKDYLQYLQFFESAGRAYDGRFEIGFVWLNLLVKSASLSFFWVLFFSAFISLSAKFYLISRQKNSLFFLLVYFILLFPIHEMTQLRISISLGFAYLSLFFSIRERLSFRVLGLLVLSVLFHWSSLLFFPFVIFSNIIKSKNFFLILLVSLIPPIVIHSSLSLLDYLNPQVSHMLKVASEMDANPFSSRNITFIIIMLLGVVNLRKIPESSMPWFYLSVAGLTLWYGLMSVPVFAHRIFEMTLFSCFFWINSLPKYSRFSALSLLFIFSVYLVFRMLYIEPLFGVNR